MNKLHRQTVWGLGLLSASVVSVMVPSTPLGTDVWQIIPFYLFVATSLSAPFVLKKAKKSGDKIAGYAFYLSWILFALCLFFLASLLLAI